MLVAIDARNRAVTVGLRDGPLWKARRRFGADPERTSDEYALLMGAAAAEALGPDALRGAVDRPARAVPRGQAGAVEAVWISSVVPALTPTLVEASASAFGVEATLALAATLAIPLAAWPRRARR
jgi:pantothenate kinase type III